MNGMTPTNKLTSMEEAYLAVQEGMKTDKVDPKQAKKDFDDRDDKDIDNDGDVDSSDKFLHKRRKAIAKKDELDEGWNYEIKNNKIHISRADFKKVHKDFKNATKGKERMSALNPKTGATTSFPVVFLDEGKIEYGIIRYPDTAISYVKNAGNGWEHIYDRSYGFKGKVDSGDLKHMSPIDKSKIPGRLIKESVDYGSRMTDAQKKKFHDLKKKMTGGPEYQKIMRKNQSRIKSDDEFHNLVLKKVMSEGSVALDEATQYKKGDKVTVNVAKASDPEMRQHAKEFGDKIGGVVQFQSGSIVSVKTSKGMLNPSVKDVVKESVELDEAFGADDVDAMCREIESGVKAILVKCKVSKLGPYPSIFINLSLDDKSDWPNGIWHNSRYGSFVLHGDGNSIELSHKHFSLPKFRKSKYKTTKDIVAKINKWIDSIAAA